MANHNFITFKTTFSTGLQPSIPDRDGPQTDYYLVSLVVQREQQLQSCLVSNQITF